MDTLLRKSNDGRVLCEFWAISVSTVLWFSFENRSRNASSWAEMISVNGRPCVAVVAAYLKKIISWIISNRNPLRAARTMEDASDGAALAAVTKNPPWSAMLLQ